MTPCVRSGFGFGLSNAFLYLMWALGFWYGAKLVKDGEADFTDIMQSIVVRVPGMRRLACALPASCCFRVPLRWCQLMVAGSPDGRARADERTGKSAWILGDGLPLILFFAAPRHRPECFGVPAADLPGSRKGQGGRRAMLRAHRQGASGGLGEDGGESPHPSRTWAHIQDCRS